MGTWQVYPGDDGNWHVVTPGGTRACAPAASKHESVAAALGLISYEGGDLLVSATTGAVHRYRIPPGGGSR